MLLFALCIAVNVFLGVIFKLFPKYGIDNIQAITVNYIVSFLLGCSILGLEKAFIDPTVQPWFGYAIFLSFTFIIGFNIIAYTFQKFGITFTTIMQKMSLIISVGFAILYFHESSSALKILGILMAMMSIVLINTEKGAGQINLKALLKKFWYLPLFTFLISGVIELILLYMEKMKISDGSDLVFVTYLFGFAGILGILSIVYSSIKTQKLPIKGKNIIAGILLGLPNFFTIYLLVLLLKNYDGSVVFPVNNVGILAFSALIAVWFFRESFSRNKQLGLLMAILSIYLISQF